MINSSVALILAKSESKRLPYKNVLEFDGKPMFIVNVLKCLDIFDKVYVSSDSDAILDDAKKVGAIPIKRENYLCGDCPNIPVYQHALKHMSNPSSIVAVQANSPSIEPNIIAVTKNLIEIADEVMTCHPDTYDIYGSVWAIQTEKLLDYRDAFNPEPKILIVDKSIDIHNKLDYTKVVKQYYEDRK